MKSVYIETSIPSYLTARPSRDVRAAAWQELTVQWWDIARSRYDLYTSEVVVAEAREGDPAAAVRRIDALRGIPELIVDAEVEALAARLIADGGFPAAASTRGDRRCTMTRSLKRSGITAKHWPSGVTITCTKSFSTYRGDRGLH